MNRLIEIESEINVLKRKLLNLEIERDNIKFDENFLDSWVMARQEIIRLPMSLPQNRTKKRIIKRSRFDCAHPKTAIFKP